MDISLAIAGALGAVIIGVLIAFVLDKVNKTERMVEEKNKPKRENVNLSMKEYWRKLPTWVKIIIATVIVQVLINLFEFIEGLICC